MPSADNIFNAAEMIIYSHADDYVATHIEHNIDD